MSLNPYLFGNADPVSFCDPSGNFSLIEFSFAGAIKAGLRAINYALKANKVCRLKGKIHLFRAIWALRTIGNYFASSTEFGGSPLAPGAGGASVAQKFTLFKAAEPVPDHTLAEVVYEQKYKSANEFEMELSAKFKTSGGAFRSDKVAVIKNLTTGQYDLAAGIEREKEIGEIKYCNFLTMGSVSVGAEGGLQTGGNNPLGLAGSVKGYIKLSAFAVGSFKFMVYQF